MGQAFGKLFNTLFGNPEIKVLILGLGAAGITTILYKLHNGTLVQSNFPTVDFVVEEIRYKNVLFTAGEIGGQLKSDFRKCIYYHYSPQVLIYVVDSLNITRIEEAKDDFQVTINDPSMLNVFILVFANKQDMEGAMTPKEVCDVLGLNDLKNRKWHIQGTCARKGDGLCEGLDWLIKSFNDLKA